MPETIWLLKIWEQDEDYSPYLAGIRAYRSESNAQDVAEFYRERLYNATVTECDLYE